MSAVEKGLSGKLVVAAHGDSSADGNLVYRAELLVHVKRADTAFPEEVSMNLTFDNLTCIQVWLCVACQASLGVVLCAPEIRGTDRPAICDAEAVKNLMKQFLSQMKGFEERVNEWQSPQKFH